MTTLTATALRTVSFGDLDAGIWGAAWAGSDALVAVGTLEQGSAIPGGRVEGSEPGEDWQLTADGVQLTLSAAGEAATESELHGFDQLCRIQGSIALPSEQRAVDCLGRRALRGQLDIDSLDSVRDFSAWFGPAEASDGAAEGLGLTALRPRDAAGHDAELIGAAVFEAGHTLPVADPRFSTTYTDAGLPIRVSLELWLEADAEGEEPYPRRAAGEALAPATVLSAPELELLARPFRCLSRGLEGAGVYLLARAT
jgi:hypothetical protein